MPLYKLDPEHSSIKFMIKHMVFSKVHGSFKKFSGEFNFDEANPKNSWASSTMEVASISTQDTSRDDHLKGDDFFDIKNFPQMSFKSTSMIFASKKLIRVIGDLTIKGVSRQVELIVDAPTFDKKTGLTAKTNLKRKEFGLTWNAAIEAGGLLVGDDVSITLDLQFVKQS